MDIKLINPTVFDNSEEVPCPKYPYTLGHFHFVDNPCSACKMNGYHTYYVHTDVCSGATIY